MGMGVGVVRPLCCGLQSERQNEGIHCAGQARPVMEDRGKLKECGDSGAKVSGSNDAKRSSEWSLENVCLI